MKHCDVFFISYDEPLANQAWEKIQARLPHAKRVHGVKGFDAAYKECAARSEQDRFFTIDGDNIPDESFYALEADFTSLPHDAVLSWSARNSLNGLIYGNGGIKNWPKSVAQQMRSHESADTEIAAVDFCFSLNYHRMTGALSDIHVHGSPYQAFRAGFREGVKMCLQRGVRPSKGADLSQFIFQHNYNRLRIWCSVGLDVENGAWAMYGARLGTKMLCQSDWNHHLIRDYDWFLGFWQNQIFPEFGGEHGWNNDKLRAALDYLERDLNKNSNLNIFTLDAPSSRFFKSAYHNPAAPSGPIFPETNLG